jgi:hypothetical protein
MEAPGSTGAHAATVTPAARTAFAALVDYAGLYPPAQLPMEAAVAEYDNARRGPFAWILGRYIVPATQVAELLGLTQTGEPFALSVIVDADREPRTWSASLIATLELLARLGADDPRVKIGALELPLPRLQAMRDTYDASIGQFAAARAHHGFRDLPAYIEIPRDARWTALLPGALAALARHRLGAKVRCGGLTADAVPSCAEIAAFIRAACEERVSFKATAGLHHPVRHLDAATGAMQHGFLNLMCATLVARAGDSDSIEPAVAEEDPAKFAWEADSFSWRGHRFDVPALAAMRESFVGYGSCSFSEPVEDLTALRVLEAAA